MDDKDPRVAALAEVVRQIRPGMDDDAYAYAYAYAYAKGYAYAQAKGYAYARAHAYAQARLFVFQLTDEQKQQIDAAYTLLFG